MDVKGDNIKDKLSKKTDDGINNEHSFQQESGSEEIQNQILYPIIDIKEEIEVKDETFYTTEENMESGQGFEGKYDTLFIKEEVMEENGQMMKIFYPIINVNEKIEVKDDKLYIKEEIMENGQGQDQGQGFDQSSELDESQVGIEILNGYLTFLMNLFQLLLQHFQLMYCENICLFIDLK
ncbi:hypothetical protein Avbf_11328 [Armadillidium vulgare]|nr:hypothetical protein Avbf_11328 [Armadillidium vulgare]